MTERIYALPDTPTPATTPAGMRGAHAWAHTATFAAAYAALHASHTFADHCVQTDGDAHNKALPGWTGHAACLRHVATYTATQALALALTNKVTGAHMRPGRIIAGLALSAISHYAIDRRNLLRWAADHTGKGRFYQLGQPRPGRDDNPTLGTGAYALDQAAHTACLYLAALLIASRPAREHA